MDICPLLFLFVSLCALGEYGSPEMTLHGISDSDSFALERLSQIFIEASAEHIAGDIVSAEAHLKQFAVLSFYN